VKDNPRARRGEVELLAGSSYPLREVGRPLEARQRIDAAFARLAQLNLYPANVVNLGAEADAALRARADDEASSGNLTAARETYTTKMPPSSTPGERSYGITGIEPCRAILLWRRRLRSCACAKMRA
jgi:hypothetical protein